MAWIAVRTSATPAVLELARVEPSGATDEYFESPIAGGPLHGGWFLLVGNRCNHRLIDERFLSRLSKHGSVIACSVEEHVMFCKAAAWESGHEVWSIQHDAQEGIFDLEAEGELPDTYPEVSHHYLEEQRREGGPDADVDLVFEVPLQIAKSITGFKHDEDVECFLEPPPRAFSDLARGRKPWWRLW